MESYQQRKEKNIKETITTKYPINKLGFNTDNRRANHASKISYSSRYIPNTNLNSSKKQLNQSRKEKDKENKKTNYYNSFKKDYDLSYLSKNEESDNLNKNKNNETKKLTLFNLSTRTYEPSDATVTDGVLRGYNDNCSFYVSGSSEIKTKTTFDNKNKNKNNNQKLGNILNNNYKRENKNSRQNRLYESKTQILNPIDYKKRDIPKDNKNKYTSRYDNKYKKHNYTSNTIVNTRLSSSNNINSNNNINSIINSNINRNNIYNINSLNTSKDNIQEKKSIHEKKNVHDKKTNLIPSSSKKPKFEDIPRYSYLRRSYFDTEPSNNIKNYNQNTVATQTITQPFIPSISVINKEEKSTIPNIDEDLNNIIKNIRKRIYKTSTNTYLEEKNKDSYYKTIVDKKPYERKKRNSTPTKTSNLDTNIDFKINTIINTTSSEKNSPAKLSSIRNYYKSVIPNNKSYRYKKNKDKDKDRLKEENIIKSIERKYHQPIYTLNKQKSISNISSSITPNITTNLTTTYTPSLTNITSDISSIVNKNRYSFLERPKLREYATKTEFHSVDKNKYDSRTIINNVREKIFEVPSKKLNITTNYKVDLSKYESKNRYEPRPFSITSSFKPEKKFNVKTEIVPRSSRNYSRNSEFEVTDIIAFRKKLRDEETSSIDKYRPKLLEPISLLKKDDNKREYTSFERSLRNIKDNENAIKKEENDRIKNRRNLAKNHYVFESNDTSKNKYLFKTSTLRQEKRSHGYSLANEYEVPMDKVLKYKKIEDDKNAFIDRNNKTDNILNIKINKNNYFNAMKNLEEEIEVDDENEQVEYLPPRPLPRFRARSKDRDKENKYTYTINKSPLEKKENRYSYLLNRGKKEDNNNNNLIVNSNNLQKINVNYIESSNLFSLNKPSINLPNSDKEIEKTNQSINVIKNQYLITNKTKEQKNKTKPTSLVPQNIQQKPIKLLPQQQIPLIFEKQQNQFQIQKEQEISHIKPQKEITTKQLEEMHQDEDVNTQQKEEKEKTNENETKDNEIEEFQNSEENNTLRKSKYSSYFGDSNNNYYEIKGYSGSKENDNDNDEEEEENENDIDDIDNEDDNNKKKNNIIKTNDYVHNNYEQPMKLERSVTFGIQSENLCVPAEHEQEPDNESKEDKEADEQPVEEDEQNDENEEKMKTNEHNEQENDDEGGELVGEENEDDENEMAEGEEIEDNIIEDNNGNEEEEINENEYEEN